MDSNSFTHITEDKVSQVADILKLGKIKHHGSGVIMKCPFCRTNTHSFYVDMSTGEYCCPTCDITGSFENLDIELLGYSIEEETSDILEKFSTPNLDGTFMAFHFVNKNLEDVLSVARFIPSLISIKNNDDNDFEFLYYFSNLKENTAQYKVIALSLLCEFEKLMSERISDDELEDNYCLFEVNNLFYKVIDHYSDSQLNSLIALFGNRLNNN